MFNCLRKSKYGLHAKDFSLLPISRVRVVLRSERQAQQSNEWLQNDIRGACGNVHVGSIRRCAHHPSSLTNKQGIRPHGSAHIRDSRCFCAVAFKEHVAVQLAGSCISNASRPRADIDTSQKTDALQAFEALLNQIQASRNDAGITDLEGLEALLAQVESSGVPGDQHRIGVACYKLAQLFNSCEKPAKVLSYAQRGFNVLKSLEAPSAKHAACRCLYAIASAYYGIRDFEKALAQAEHLDLILQQLEKRFPEEDVTFLKYAVQTFLIKCKMSVGRQEETLPHFRKYIELKEKLVEPGDSELGAAYIQAAEAFQEANYPAEAIGLGFKALHIHTKKFGPSSYQVAYVRRLLSEAYYDLGHFEDSLSEYDKARPILEALEDNSLEVMAPFILKSALSLIELEKYDKATARLKEIIGNTSKACDSHALALATLAKVYALLSLDKEFFVCCKKALDVLENHQKVSIFTGQNIFLLASSLGNKKHYEQAILLYKKALQIFNQCPGSEAALKAADTEGEIGIALLRLGHFPQAAPYVKSYALKSKIIDGSDNKRSLAVHNRLGAEYLQVGRFSEALEQLETARLLLSKDLTGVNEAIMIALNQNLATAYNVLGRLEEALVCQKTAVDTVKKSEREEIRSLLAEVEKPLEALSQQRHAKNTSELS